MRKVLALTSLIYLLTPSAILAADTLPGRGPGPVAPGGGCSSFISCISTIQGPQGLTITSEQGLVGQIITLFLPVVLGIAGFITVIIIVVSGIQFITSGGNPEAANAARGRLIYALIGFAVIVLAFAALQIIDNIFLGNSGVV